MKQAVFFRLQLFFIYYKSTLTINVIIALFFAVLAYTSGFAVQMFAVSFCTAGPVICILYKEIAEQDQYYFYYNLGVSKVQLISGFMGLNVFTSLAVYLLHLL